jgi:hypothetical protein
LLCKERMRKYDETAVLAIVDELVTRGSSMHWYGVGTHETKYAL